MSFINISFNSVQLANKHLTVCLLCCWDWMKKKKGYISLSIISNWFLWLIFYVYGVLANYVANAIHNKCFTTYKIQFYLVFLFVYINVCVCMCIMLSHRLSPNNLSNSTLLYCLAYNKMQIRDTNHLKSTIFFCVCSFPSIQSNANNTIIDDSCKRCHLMWSCQTPA